MWAQHILSKFKCSQTLACTRTFCRTLQSNGVGANLSSDGVGETKKEIGGKTEKWPKGLWKWWKYSILGQVFNFLKLKFNFKFCFVLHLSLSILISVVVNSVLGTGGIRCVFHGVMRRGKGTAYAGGGNQGKAPGFSKSRTSESEVTKRNGNPRVPQEKERWNGAQNHFYLNITKMVCP